MRRDDQLAGGVEAEPASNVVELALDSQRGRGENDRGDLVEQPFVEQFRDVDRSGLQEDAAPAPLHPIDEPLVVALDQKPYLLVQLRDPPLQRDHFVGLLLDAF